jgi:7,8-dihydro-6-hydroxymethylpterin-pyrophosphokinase
MGRKKVLRYGPRIIDIDILFYGNQVVKSKNLIIPHPKIGQRKFVLIPLNQIAPRKVHPVEKKSAMVLLKECGDDSKVDVFC